MKINWPLLDEADVLPIVQMYATGTNVDTLRDETLGPVLRFVAERLRIARGEAYLPDVQADWVLRAARMYTATPPSRHAHIQLLKAWESALLYACGMHSTSVKAYSNLGQLYVHMGVLGVYEMLVLLHSGAVYSSERSGSPWSRRMLGVALDRLFATVFDEPMPVRIAYNEEPF